MQERRPPQPIAIVLRQAELRRHEVGERPHPLAVAAGLAVVRGQRRDEPQDLLGRAGGSGIHAFLACVADPALEDPDVARAARHREPGRRAVREDEGQAEEHREWEEPHREPLGDRDDDRRAGEEADEPRDPCEAAGRGQRVRVPQGAGDPGRGRDEHGREPEREGQRRPGSPAPVVASRLRSCHRPFLRVRRGPSLPLNHHRPTTVRAIPAGDVASGRDADATTGYVLRSPVHGRVSHRARRAQGRRRVVGRGRRTRAPAVQPEQGLLDERGLHEGRP